LQGSIFFCTFAASLYQFTIMKSNFNIFILLFVCLLVGSIWHVVHVCMNMSSTVDYNPGNVTQLLGGEADGEAKSSSPFTNVTFSGGSSSDNAFSLNGLRRQTMSSTSRMKAKSAFSYARMSENTSPSSLLASSPQSSSTSPIGHMTSDAQYHSFGGGGNMGSSPIAYSQSPIAYSPSPIVNNPSQITYSQLPIANNLLAPSSAGNGAEEVMVAAEQSFSMASASYTSPFASSYAYNSYGVASYGATSNPNRLGGRQNAPSTGLGNSWLNWLDDNYGSTLGDGGTWNMDWQDAYNAWLALCASWNTTMGPAPSWEQFLAWLESNEGVHTKGEHTYNYVPVGNVLPLFLMALIYAIILFVKRNKTAQI
jgi:hypothetical protein